MRGEALGEPLLGLALQLLALVERSGIRAACRSSAGWACASARRVAQRMAISTLACSASGRSANSSIICWRVLKSMLRRQAAAVVVGDEPPFGDGEQRVVRLVILRRGEERLVRGDDGQAVAIGERQQLALDQPLARRSPWRWIST